MDPPGKRVKTQADHDQTAGSGDKVEETVGDWGIVKSEPLTGRHTCNGLKPMLLSEFARDKESMRLHSAMKRRATEMNCPSLGQTAVLKVEQLKKVVLEIAASDVAEGAAEDEHDCVISFLTAYKSLKPESFTRAAEWLGTLGGLADACEVKRVVVMMMLFIETMEGRMDLMVTFLNDFVESNVLLALVEKENWLVHEALWDNVVLAGAVKGDKTDLSDRYVRLLPFDMEPADDGTGRYSAWGFSGCYIAMWYLLMGCFPDAENGPAVLAASMSTAIIQAQRERAAELLRDGFESEAKDATAAADRLQNDQFKALEAVINATPEDEDTPEPYVDSDVPGGRQDTPHVFAHALENCLGESSMLSRVFHLVMFVNIPEGWTLPREMEYLYKGSGVYYNDDDDDDENEDGGSNVGD
jgi:hypothetical protein